MGDTVSGYKVQSNEETYPIALSGLYTQVQIHMLVHTHTTHIYEQNKNLKDILGLAGLNHFIVLWEKGALLVVYFLALW